jgi:hypothetical protein
MKVVYKDFFHYFTANNNAKKNPTLEKMSDLIEREI